VLGRDPHAFLLESVVGGEQVGAIQLHRHRSRHWSIRWRAKCAGSPARGWAGLKSSQPPIRFAIFRVASRTANTITPKICPRLLGGWSVMPGTTPSAITRGEAHVSAEDDRHIPDLLFGLYNELVIFDHVDKTIKWSPTRPQ